jgi:hypothetical protein
MSYKGERPRFDADSPWGAALTPAQAAWVVECLREEVVHHRRIQPGGPWWRRLWFHLKEAWDWTLVVEEHATLEPMVCDRCEEEGVLEVRGFGGTWLWDGPATPGDGPPQRCVALLYTGCPACGAVQVFDAVALGVVDAQGRWGNEGENEAAPAAEEAEEAEEVEG